MKKSNEKLIQTMVFDDVAYATNIKEECEKKLAKVKLGLKISIFPSVFSVLYLILESAHVRNGFSSFVYLMMLLGILVSIAAYVIGGGLKTALSWAWKICKIGWFIMPFPVDIVTGIVAFIFSFFAFWCFPVAFVGMNYLQIKSDYTAALDYLKCCKPVESTQE